MDVGIVLSVAQTLFAALQCAELREICSLFGYKSELEKLSKTVATIRALFLDAEAKQEELSHEAQVWIQELKDAVYDADDLLDEFVTQAERKQLMKGGKISKEVRAFFSRLNPLGVAYSMSHGVKKIRRTLDAIASNHRDYGLTINSEPLRRRREETCSYVHAGNIVGREADTEKIVGMLLDPSVQRDVSFLTIVGIGGLGKTTLAQLVYNHERIIKEFELRLWVCVSDQDQRQLNIKGILGKILESATGEKKPDDSAMDRVQSQLREQLTGKKYLLVLDDVWNENRDEWVKLVEFLMGGRKGSWVVVTTRSQETARVVGNGPTYELQGLTKDESWLLFERTAFEKVGEQANPSDLVEIGHEIVERCANVPLAIRVMGSLLYGQGKNKWLSFRKIGLANIRHGENGIMPILKFSYHHLESPLKSCFSYCALFPKDFRIGKEMLISLWMSQGYVVPLDKGQSLEDAGKEYFSLLWRRCFFQDVETNKDGEVISCKIHDLMHDIAEEVAGKEICHANSLGSNLDKKIRHLSLMESSGSYFSGTKIRSYLQISDRSKCPLETFLPNCTCLRALHLDSSGIESLPSAIDKLVHLRYLDLSHNCYLIELPESIVELHNLQTLKLVDCNRLKELPKDLSKLVKLRVLDITKCVGLTDMPSGMGNLCSLHKLTMFVVGETISSSKGCITDKLEDLKALTNLKGHLLIRIIKRFTYVKENGEEGGYLRRMEHLKRVEWNFWESYSKAKYEEELLEDMHPHPNLKELALNRYAGVRIPSWARDGNLKIFLPNLVTIRIQYCHKLQYLPMLGNLRHLKFLAVEYSGSLEYMENSSSSSSYGSELSLFPSLEELFLNCLQKLKGWWRDDELVIDSNSRQPRTIVLPSFGSLSKLRIYQCRELTCIPSCPTVEQVVLKGANERLRIIRNMGDQDQQATSSSSSSSYPPKLRRVEVEKIRYLKLMPIEAFQCVTDMSFSGGGRETGNLSVVGEVFQVCSSSLRSLVINHYHGDIYEREWWDHLTALDSLQLASIDDLHMAEEDDDDAAMSLPWGQSFHHTLLSLKLSYLRNLVKLPKWMQYLTSLQTLEIAHCSNLKTLPEWIGCLSSLQSLTIKSCTGLQSLPESMRQLTSLTQLYISWCSKSLKKRCQNPNGECWPYIRHIPNISIS